VDYADEPHTIIHAMASLVRVAPSYRLQQPGRKIASGVAPRRRTAMDFGHDQRFRTTLGLSEAAPTTNQTGLYLTTFSSLRVGRR